MPEADPGANAVDVENEETMDEFLVSICESCDEPIMTMIGDSTETWVHERTEAVHCAEEPKKKLTKGELIERLEEAESLLQAAAIWIADVPSNLAALLARNIERFLEDD